MNVRQLEVVVGWISCDNRREYWKKAKMRILMLAPGSWIHTKRTLNCLLKSGHEVTLIDGHNPLPEGRDGFNFLAYPRTGSRFYRRLIGKNRAYSIAKFLVTAQLRKIWKELKPDVVHVCWLDERAHHCVQAGIKPLMLSVWGSDVNLHLLAEAQPDQVKMVAGALASADVTVVDAPDMHGKCSTLAGKPIRTEELHLGADTQLFKPDPEGAKGLRQRLEIPSGAKVLVSVRAMAARYGHKVILEAFARAFPRLNHGAYLVFKDYSGSDPSYLLSLRWLARECGIEKSVRWIGELPLEKLPELYALSEAIINFPTMDAFPVTFIEAAACERMVITCKQQSYEGTFAEKYFRMVEAGNAEALTDAIVDLLNETPSQREQRLVRLSELRQFVLREYDETVFSRRLSELYREIADC
jgi:glycosyltransferase involved in cell wall biosynthesis